MRTAQVVRVHGMKGVESVSGENPVVKWGSFQESVVEGKYGIPWHVSLELETKNTGSTYVCPNILHRM